MTFEAIEKYLEKMEALQGYEGVVRENAELKQRLQSQRAEYEARERKYEEKIGRLEAEISQWENLRIQYDGSEYGLKELDSLVQADAEKRLEEWKEQELQKQVDERWQATGPGLVEQKLRTEISSYPRSCSPEVRKLIESKTADEVKRILGNRLKWPEYLRNLFQSELREGIEKGLDEDFKKRVEAQANNRLQQLIQVEWPKFIEDRITPFCQTSLKSQLEKISSPQNIQCNRCGTPMDVTLTPNDMANLIKRRIIEIRCSNPNCRFLGRPTKVPLTLGHIIANIIELRQIVTGTYTATPMYTAKDQDSPKSEDT